MPNRGEIMSWLRGTNMFSEPPLRLSIWLEGGEHEHLRSTMPLDLPMHEARLLILRLLAEVQRTQEVEAAAARAVTDAHPKVEEQP
jgi:hypothetical protein